MYRGWPVIKREFVEMARTKAYIIGTLLGPFIIVLLMVGPLLFMRAGGGGLREVVILDATGVGVGQDVARTLEASDLDAMEGRGSRFVVEVVEVEGAAEAERRSARARIASDSEDALDGYLFLSPGFLESNQALYEGRNATATIQMRQIRSAIQEAVQARRMGEAGVSPAVASRIFARVTLDARKPGRDEDEGQGADTAFFLGVLMAMAVYFAVVLFAASVMRGVLEEKRDRIVEVLLSSISARQFIVGKVLGIGAASLFQMLVWVGFAAAAITWGPEIAARYGVDFPSLPEIPGRVAVVFLFFFMTGFLLYAALFGAAGAIATSDQEANQMQFPVTLPLVFGIFMMYSLMADPDSSIAVTGSVIPFTAPVVMPMRSMMTDIPAVQYIGSILFMLATLVAIMWAAAKIYRIGVLSTGKRPTMKELARWLKTA
jgi:ABC-2 type transport system permease protein